MFVSQTLFADAFGSNFLSPFSVTSCEGINASSACYPYSGDLLSRILLDPRCLPWRIGIPPRASTC